MESSVEELIIKTRKPYTITKQRERWTVEEHGRFLEALKLYGRAWQRIEEHIGTKTAVQIRSHAQKFFSKLEKEALIKGVSLAQTLDIKIPPPRPKRKPSKPYPQKTKVGASTSFLAGEKDGKLLTSTTSLYPGKQMLDVENDPAPKKPIGTENIVRPKETLDEDSGSEVLTLFQEAPCASISLESKSYKPTSVLHANSCTFREFAPPRKEISDQGATDESYLTVEPKRNQKVDRTDANYTDLDNCKSETPKLEKCCHNIHEKLVNKEKTDEIKQPEKIGLPTDEIQANQSFPRHVPVHIVDGNSGSCMLTQSSDTYPPSILYQVGGAHLTPNLFTNTATSATTEHHSSVSRSSFQQSMPNFATPFSPFLPNQDVYQSFPNISSTFPSHLVPHLLQNPAANIAPSLAYPFWPCTNVETPVDSPAGTLEGFPVRHMSAPTNLVAIAAATVAAASAWWAAHGMLPFYPPFHPGFTHPTAPITAIPVGSGQVPVVNTEGKDNSPLDPPWEGPQLDPEFSEVLKPQHSASKSPTLSSSDSEGSRGARSNNDELKAVDHEQKPAPITGGHHDSTKAKTRKNVDRSSCGSNSPSSSDVEKEALEKHEKGKDESKESDVNHLAGEPNNRRSRSMSNVNESWKEVSEEGRLAFQALFSREVLPQSFSPSHDLTKKGQPKSSTKDGMQNDKKDEDDTLRLSLNSKTWEVNPDNLGLDKSALLVGKNEEKGVLSMGLGHGRLKARRTGFKPYKRCSIEAKESRLMNVSGQGGENSSKRMRLEGDAST